MTSKKTRVLAINGIADSGQVYVAGANSFGKILFDTSGSCDCARYFNSQDFDVNHFIIDHLEQQQINSEYILSHDVVFCEISDPDSHSFSLKKAQHLFQKFSEKIPWINNPGFVPRTSRDNIPSLLQGIDGVIAPRTIKLCPSTASDIESAINGKKLSLPCLIRPAGSHGGKDLLLIKSFDELQNIDVSIYKEMFITEYVDYQIDNVFSKYRFAVIAGEPVIRHVIFNDQWIIHSESRSYMAKHPELQQREAEIIATFDSKLKPEIENPVRIIYEAIGLDYFGIDCAIKDNKMILFEVNPTMNILADNQPKPNIWEQQIETIISKLQDKLVASQVNSPG